MNFFDIGTGEILLILVVALIVWGPERLAEMGKTLGKTVHSFRKAASDLTTQVSKELELEKAEKPQNEMKPAVPQQEAKATTTPPPPSVDQGEHEATPPH